MSIKKNYCYNLVYQLLILVLPLITTPYISRIFNARGIGVYSYANSIANYFMLFAMLGLNNYGNRVVAQTKHDKKLLSKNFWNIYCLQAILSLIVLIIYIPTVFFQGLLYRKVLLIQSLMVISTFLDINWLFFGLEQFKITVIRNAIIRIITTVCIFIFVKTKNDIYIYTFIMSMGVFLSQSVLWPFVKNYVDYVRPTPKEILKHLIPNFILFIPVIAVSIYRIMDKIMIGMLSEIVQVGLYENAERIVTIPLALITSLGTVMLPAMSKISILNDIKKRNKYIHDSMIFVVFLSSAMMFGIMSIANRFVSIYLGSGFEKCGIIMIFLSPILLFASWGNVIRTQFLIPNGKDVIYVKSVILGAVINVILNLIFIKHFGALGAVFGTLAAEFSVALYQTVLIREELPIRDYFRESVYFIFCGLFMYIVVKILGQNIKNNILGIILLVVCGVIIYMVSTIILTKILYPLKYALVKEKILKKVDVYCK